jgi:hypothetical protein
MNAYNLTACNEGVASNKASGTKSVCSLEIVPRRDGLLLDLDDIFDLPYPIPPALQCGVHLRESNQEYLFLG